MQSRKMSFVEAVTNVIVGFVLAVLTQMLVFPAFGLIVAFDQHVSIAVIFTMLSLGRGYILRRLFEGSGLAAAGAPYSQSWRTLGEPSLKHLTFSPQPCSAQGKPNLVGLLHPNCSCRKICRRHCSI